MDKSATRSSTAKAETATVAGDNRPVRPDAARERLLTDEPRKLIIRLGTPVTIGFVIAALFNLVDSLFVAQLDEGTAALAAVGAAFFIDLILMAIGGGMSQGTASAIGRRVGAGDYAAATVAGRQAVTLLVLLTALGMLAALGAGPLIELVAADDPLVLAGATDYATVVLFGCFGWFGSQILGGILRGLGDMKAPMYANLTAIFLNVVLNPLFIFDFGLGLGVWGAALATVLSRSVAGLYLVRVLLDRRRNPLGRAVLRPGLHRPTMADILRIGLPGAAATSIVAINLGVISFLVGHHVAGIEGTVGQAAFLIGYRLDQLAFLSVLGMAIALTTVVAQNHGAGLIDRERAALRACARVATTVLAGFALVYLVAADWIVSLWDTGDPAVLAAAADYLRISALGLPFLGLTLSVTTAFNGRGRGMPNLVLTTLRMFGVGLPIFLLLRTAGLPLFWIAIPISAMVTAGVAWFWIRAELRRDMASAARGIRFADPDPDPDRD